MIANQGQIGVHMLTDISILIVEDDAILGKNLCVAAEDRDCRPVGAATTVTEALALLKNASIDAAILDANLLDRDVTPVAMMLIDKAIPFIIHTGFGLPEELKTVYPQVSVIMKPADPDDVVVQLLSQVERLRQGSPAHASLSVGDNDGASRRRKIDRICDALTEQFGNRAVTLAERQAADADGDARVAWIDILEGLKERSTASA
jgi:ActR/RegA family two-component response regulator